MKNLLFTVLFIIFLISLTIFVFANVYNILPLPKIVEEINSAAIGAILTAVITVFLLGQQFETEEKKEKQSKVFEKR